MINKVQRYPAVFIRWRFYFVIFFILFIVAGLIARLIDLTILEKKFLLNQGNARAMRIMQIPAFRGMITDREGYPLAISTSVYSIWMNPKEFIINPKNLMILSQLLNLKASDLEKQILFYKNKNREFMYLKRDAIPEIATKIKKLEMLGVYQQQEYKRYYPEGETTAHIIGFTNVDDQGQEGLELLYNTWLSGAQGKKIVLKDRLGRVISDVQTLQKQQPGNDLILSVDHKLQYLAYRALLEGIKKNNATAGSVIVLNPKTGEILAMVNYPSYNPNNRGIKDLQALRNRAVTDIFEPGSTMKAFSVATALASGIYKPETIIDTYPGWLNVGRRLVRDEHSKGPMTVTQILQISSNVGVTKMILSLPPENLWKFLHVVGFGEETNINFPGERSGVLLKRDKWPPFALATLAFGYGVSVTTLQLAQAYAILANDGIKLPLSLMKLNESPKGKRVIDSKLAKQMIYLLEAVVSKGGSAHSANLAGYRVAGKTGTSKMLGKHGYEKRYVSSFVGIAPATHPQLVVAVVINDPKGKKYYGGDVSAPVFKTIMEGALRMLNVPPDETPAPTFIPFDRNAKREPMPRTLG